LSMNPFDPLLQRTRRHFFRDCAVGLGSLGLASLLSGGKLHAGEKSALSPTAPKPPHFPAKAKSVIYLFMAGGPSQLELWDWKPTLVEMHGQPIPESFIKGKRFAFMDTFTKEVPKLLGTRRKFAKQGDCGTWVSECLPHTAGMVDELTVMRAVAT